MAVTVVATRVNLVIESYQAGISPTAQRGQSTFNSPLLPQPPSLLSAHSHPDPAVRELILWTHAVSQILQEKLNE